MLFDPRWEKKTKADPFSLESLIAWLEKQPRTRTYDYFDVDGTCLIGLYSSDVGCDFRDCHHAFWVRNELHEIARPWPWTAGAALERARATLFAE